MEIGNRNEYMTYAGRNAGYISAAQKPKKAAAGMGFAAAAQAVDERAAVEQESAADKYATQALDSVGPNAPQNVRDAWMEAARETGANGLGIKGNGMMSHISQMLVQQLTNVMQGKPNPYDILGKSVQSALIATKKALSDLENPLDPVSRKSPEVQKQIQKEKEFYQAFIQKLEAL